MTRLLLLLALLVGAATGIATPAAAEPIDQAGWAERKREVVLPNGLRMAYVELGNPDGRPLLLLHGYTDSSRTWTILAPYLAEYRLLIPDQRGHGASDVPACCYAMSDLAEDARLFLDALGVRRAAVVGHSMGSMVAQVLAAEHPDRVERLVLIGSTALVAVRRDDWMWRQVMGLREPIASNREFLRAWGPGGTPTPVDPVFTRYADRDIAAVAPLVWRSVLRELVDVPIGRYAPDIAAPVLILSGGRDELFPPAHHRALVAAFPGARDHVFADLGHNLIWERPEEVAPVLVAFLGQPQANAARRRTS